MLNRCKSHEHSYCGLNGDEFNRTSKFKNAKKIWDMLEVTHKKQIKLRI